MASRKNYHRIWYSAHSGPHENGLCDEQIGVAYSPEKGDPNRRWFDVVTGEIGGLNKMDDPILVAALDEVLPDLKLYRERVLELISMNPGGFTPEYSEKSRTMRLDLWAIMDKLDQVSHSPKLKSKPSPGMTP